MNGSQNIWGDRSTQFFYSLTPDTILDNIESLGIETTSRVLILNSMENRVYEIEISIDESKIKSESDKFIIAKFYRPGRWTKEQILEEHQFLFDLEENEVPVIAPLKINGESVFQVRDQEMFFCLFPKKSGRCLDELNLERRQILGRTLARLHNIGKMHPAKHRLKLTPKIFIEENTKTLLTGKFIPSHIEDSFKQTVDLIYQLVGPMFEGVENQRIHGDCHYGNIIWRDEGPYFIDFDDMLTGPLVQDIWLINPGDDEESIRHRNEILEAYELMGDFPHHSLKLVEPLRTMRFIHFYAWIGKRYQDPAFQQQFPQFREQTYFETALNDLRMQYAKIQESLAPSYY